MDSIEKPRRGRPPKSSQIDENLPWPPPDATPDEAPAHFQKTKKELVESNKKLERVYAKQQELDHDLYKLKVASLVRNASYNESQPIFENVEHCHYFHSIDSRGRKMETSSKVGGHFHKMEVQPDGTVICGPAVTEVKVKKHGRVVTEYRTNRHDTHTHEVEYRFSEKIKPQTPNVEFAKVQSKVAEAQTRRDAIRIDDVVEND